MEIAISFLFLIFGFALLIKGADILVNGSSALARRFNISELVIGLTIVSFGTSAPELVVNIISAAEGSSGLVFGNVIGSNLFNILVVLGVSAVITPLSVTRGTTWREIPFGLLGALILFIMTNDILVDGFSQNVLSRSDGLVLLAFFLMFLAYVFAISRNKAPSPEEMVTYSLGKSLLFIFGGLAALVWGGDIVVTNSVAIAKHWGVSEKLIGLTIVAAGTSLPELATSAVASYRGKNDIAVGNVVGSNIFNIFLILGVSATIHPAAYDSRINEDLYVLITASLLLFLFMFVGKKNRLNRKEGALFLVIFIVYLVYIVIRG